MWNYFKRGRDINTQKLKKLSLNCVEHEVKFNHYIASLWMLCFTFISAFDEYNTQIHKTKINALGYK